MVLMSEKKQTIYALSTPSGKSAIAVVRISGPKAYNYVKLISSSMPKKPNSSVTNLLKDNDGEIIDKTITTFFKGPKSYTGEDMIEISMHGGDASINKFFEIFSKKKDVRMAERGEFTKRAFENNKIDLIQAEAIDDLVNAETDLQRKQAHNQLDGNFSNKTKNIFDKLKKILANTEAIIDFADEELPKNLEKEIREQIENIKKEIKKILSGKDIGRKIRNGFVVGIIGKTNVGKSSFINYISDKDLAIVTKTPGTTRDLLEYFLDLKGIPVRFFDTAGIRRSKNPIEKIGIEKSVLVSKNADINLVFIENIKDIAFFKKTSNAIYVQSKQDISKKIINFKGVSKISSISGKGIDKLLKKIYKKLSKKIVPENTYISRERHHKSLINAYEYINDCKKDSNYDIVSENIRMALKEISKIYGNVDIEDILDIIFNDFCIGK